MAQTRRFDSDSDAVAPPPDDGGGQGSFTRPSDVMAVRRPEEHPPDERIVGATGGPALHRDPAHDVAPGSGGAVAGGLTPVAIIAALLLVGILLAAWALTR